MNEVCKQEISPPGVLAMAPHLNADSCTRTMSPLLGLMPRLPPRFLQYWSQNDQAYMTADESATGSITPPGIYLGGTDSAAVVLQALKHVRLQWNIYAPHCLCRRCGRRSIRVQ